MKTEFQYIHFIQQPGKGITSIWACRNIHSEEGLGIIKWNRWWRQYCYFPTIQAVYSAGYLKDIAEFIGLLMNGRTKKEE